MSRRSISRAAERFSDRDLLLIPGEEPDANFGGHYMFVFPKPALTSRTCKAPAQATGAASRIREELAPYGKVYHTTTAANELDLLKQESGLVWQTHPRTKGSAGYPDAVREKRLLPQRPFPGRVVPVAAGRSIGEAPVRSALPRPAGRHEQLGRSEVHDRRRRHLHEVSGRRDLSRSWM